MNNFLVSIPGQVAHRMRAVIPQRQRSKIIVKLIEKEIEQREKALYECILAVEQDMTLNEEMMEWDVTLQDGLVDQSTSI